MNFPNGKMWHIVICSFIIGGCVSKSQDQNGKKLVRRSIEENYHQYNASDIGYYTGRNVSNKTEGNHTVWYIQDGPVMKKIVNDHRMNVYDHIKGGLYPGVSAYVQTYDGKWYKIDNASTELRTYISLLGMCIEEKKAPYIGAGHFKPAKVKFDDGFLIQEDQLNQLYKRDNKSDDY